MRPITMTLSINRTKLYTEYFIMCVCAPGPMQSLVSCADGLSASRLIVVSAPIEIDRRPARCHANLWHQFRVSSASVQFHVHAAYVTDEFLIAIMTRTVSDIWCAVVGVILNDHFKRRSHNVYWSPIINRLVCGGEAGCVLLFNLQLNLAPCWAADGRTRGHSSCWACALCWWWGH